MSTDAKRAANAAYQRRQDALTIRPPRAEGSAIRSAAAAAGMSAQAWIRAACADEQMDLIFFRLYHAVNAPIAQDTVQFAGDKAEHNAVHRHGDSSFIRIKWEALFVPSGQRSLFRGKTKRETVRKERGRRLLRILLRQRRLGSFMYALPVFLIGCSVTRKSGGKAYPLYHFPPAKQRAKQGMRGRDGS